jgi:hypothetical protein
LVTNLRQVQRLELIREAGGHITQPIQHQNPGVQAAGQHHPEHHGELVGEIPSFHRLCFRWAADMETLCTGHRDAHCGSDLINHTANNQYETIIAPIDQQPGQRWTDHADDYK